MNFQTVSTAEKLLTSDGLTGGYLPGTDHARAAAAAGARLHQRPSCRRWTNEIQAQGLADSTAIIVSAKHGQSPQDPNSADPDQGRSDHRSDQRRLGSGSPRGRRR